MLILVILDFVDVVIRVSQQITTGVPHTIDVKFLWSDNSHASIHVYVVEVIETYEHQDMLCESNLTHLVAIYCMTVLHKCAHHIYPF